jgi:hypothetical protein
VFLGVFVVNRMQPDEKLTLSATVPGDWIQPFPCLPWANRRSGFGDRRFDAPRGVGLLALAATPKAAHRGWFALPITSRTWRDGRAAYRGGWVSERFGADDSESRPYLLA